ncbi:hypothetical protein DXG03_005255 [Asterophora parasitica]|uniref:Uncharacterized protein n=1 Tax=Asterophora parasitica TaxID=117018 RepID=A0A9P7G1U0_9AGAR|nr:hypothetical protein DXG03_005255 [Asterophora parasitica]
MPIRKDSLLKPELHDRSMSRLLPNCHVDSTYTHTDARTAPALNMSTKSDPMSTSQQPLSAEDRLTTLEMKMASIHTTLLNNSTGMEQITALLKALTPGNVPPAPMAPTVNPAPIPPASSTPNASPPTPDASTPLGDISRLRPAPPPVYDGSQTGGQAFMQACKLYISLCQKTFANDNVKIGWVLMYMQHGRAAEFVTRVFTFGGVQQVFKDWASFEVTFADEFYAQDEVRNASPYTGVHHLLPKRLVSLDAKITKRLGAIVTNRLSEVKVEEWMQAARQQELLMRADEDFFRWQVPAPTCAFEQHQTLPSAPLRHHQLTLPANQPQSPFLGSQCWCPMPWQPNHSPLVCPWTSTALEQCDPTCRMTISVVDANSQGTMHEIAPTAGISAPCHLTSWMS